MSTGQLPYTISEGRPPLRNTSSEAGAPPSEVRIENNSDRKFSKSKFFQVILETTFVHVSCYPDHYEPKIFFSVFKVHTYPSIHDFGLEGSPCNAISEGRPPLRNTSSEAGAPPSEVRIENDSDRKSSKSKFFWKLLLFMFHATLIIMSRKYFFRFSKVTHTLRYTILDSRAPLVMRSRKAGLPFAIRARKLRKLGSSAFRGTYRECTYNRNSRKAVNLISFIYLILVENVTFGPQILWKIRKLGPQI